MKRSLILITIASYMALALTLLDFSSVPKKTEANSEKPADLIVHEWGTFTSIAGKSGVAIDWRPLNGASDLPKFVYTEADNDGFRQTYERGGKGVLARVRMETPVIYFYTQREMDVNVRVVFWNGKITEWYPQASYVNSEFAPGKTGKTFGNGVNWGTIKLLPNEKPNFLRETSYSHYYPARETDAVPVQVCNADKTKIEKEKFLFYRGVGNFDLPLIVKLNDRKITLNSFGAEKINNLIVFENRGGNIGFRFIESLTKETTVERPETTKSLDAVLNELQRILVAEGLYPKEAKAMIETWKDSWFEEGLRVFYILPRGTTDKILPLQIAPEPKETVRVMVGRAEVITPEIERDVKKQVSLLKSSSAKTREEAQTYLKRYGRFYEPILRNILESEQDAKVREQIQELISLS
jgi:ribosomal protein L35AE/L33A